jgi:hypothetical protein
MRAVVTVIFGVIQWDCYSYCVKIRYQETTSKDRKDFMCAVVTVTFEVCNSVRLS